MKRRILKLLPPLEGIISDYGVYLDEVSQRIEELNTLVGESLSGLDYIYPLIGCCYDVLHSLQTCNLSDIEAGYDHYLDVYHDDIMYLILETTHDHGLDVDEACLKDTVLDIASKMASIACQFFKHLSRSEMLWNNIDVNSVLQIVIHDDVYFTAIEYTVAI